MRILSIFVLSALALASVAQNYTITGTADAKYNGKKAYLIDQNTYDYADSCVVENGSFVFKGEVSDQALYEVNINNNRRNRVYAFVEPKSAVVIDFTVSPATVKDNGGLNDKMNAIESEVSKAGDALNVKIAEMQSQGKSRDEIAAALNPELEKLYDIYRNAIKENKNNIIAAYILGMVAPQFYSSLAEFEEATNGVKYADKVFAVRKYREELLKAAATQAGKMFVDFTGLTVDGQPSKLSDYVGKGKYVLVDFWASWCGPCKGEIPNLIELQEKFGGEKFTVLGVNVWDEEDKFKAALTAEGITYPQIYIPRDNKDNATELYGIKGIPQIILFAPDGTIVQRDLRGNAMKALVSEEMSK